MCGQRFRALRGVIGANYSRMSCAGTVRRAARVVYQRRMDAHRSPTPHTAVTRRLSACCWTVALMLR